MPQTRDNGIVVPINSDEYNLTADLATMADSADVITVVSGATARNALTGYEGRAAYREDTGQVEFYTGGAWRDGTREYAPINPTGWSAAGSVTITPEGTKRRVIVDLVITRTGGAFVLGTTSWSVLGTSDNVLPTAARGTAPVKYLSCSVVGGAANYTANVAFNPNGQVSIRAINSFTFNDAALFTINVAYYI